MNITRAENNGRLLSNMRGAYPVTMICVLEGRGTEEYPYEEVKYVIGEMGNIIGRVNSEWQFADHIKSI